MNGVNGGIISGLSIQSVAAGVAVVLFSAILYRKTWPPASLSRRVLLGALRAAAFLLLLIFIVNPLFVSVASETRRPVLPVMLDVSRSMGIADKNGKTRIEAAVEASRLLPEIFEGADVRIIPFSAGVMPDSTEGGEYRATGEGTDIVGAVMSVLGRFQSENLRSVIVISDGRVTRGMKSPPGAFKVPLHLVAAGEQCGKPRHQDRRYDLRENRAGRHAARNRNDRQRRRGGRRFRDGRAARGRPGRRFPEDRHGRRERRIRRGAPLHAAIGGGAQADGEGVGRHRRKDKGKQFRETADHRAEGQNRYPDDRQASGLGHGLHQGDREALRKVRYRRGRVEAAARIQDRWRERERGARRHRSAIRACHRRR